MLYQLFVNTLIKVKVEDGGYVKGEVEVEEGEKVPFWKKMKYLLRILGLLLNDGLWLKAIC